MPAENDGIVGSGADDGDYVEMSSASYCSTDADQLKPHEVAMLRRILLKSGNQNNLFKEGRPHLQPHTQRQDQQFRASVGTVGTSMSNESEQSEFRQTSHSWLVRQEKDAAAKIRHRLDRFVGALIVSFQLFTYYLFAAEAIEDYQKGSVEVFTTHGTCLESGYAPQDNLQCEAEKTYLADAFVSFFMLSMFLAADIQQAFRSVRKASSWLTLISATFVALEVFSAFLAASISISQKLYIGEVTDAIEAGVGLLFIRELSTRAYDGMRQKKRKAYLSFFLVLVVSIVLGMLVHPVCEVLFAP